MSSMEAVEYTRRSNRRVVISESGQPELPEEWDFEPEISDDDFSEETSEFRHQRMLVHVAPSQFTEFAIKVRHEQKLVPFSFDKRRYLRLPYDTTSKRILLMCGRQVEKSTMIGNKVLAYCAINNNFNVLYVSPTNQQTKTFSADRLREPMETSDQLKAWTTSKTPDNVFLKKFINRSQCTLRYAYHNADRVRGIPADFVCIDEIQDIITDNIPVIEECASHSPPQYQFFQYSGTPKSYDNTIEKYWSEFSTQNEWVVPCERHGVPGDPATWYWNILGEANIGKEGLICEKCGGLIDPSHPRAQWAMTNPSVLQRLKEPYEGFRIPQLMVPWMYENWGKILDKYEKATSRAVFMNEVLGQSFDSGQRPLTQQDVYDNCQPGLLMTIEALTELKRRFGAGVPIFAGVDWGTGENTYTVLSLGAYFPDGRFTIFYIHRFQGQDSEPQRQLDQISQLIEAWGVQRVGCDYGGGHWPNDVLQRKFGQNRILKYQYSTPSKKVKWDPELKRFLVHRTEVMSDIFSAIKRRNVYRFPDWTAFQNPFAQDMLNIFSEYNEQAREIQYDHSKDKTDDTFHSILYCTLASMLSVPNFEILNPNKKTGIAAASSEFD